MPAGDWVPFVLVGRPTNLSGGIAGFVGDESKSSLVNNEAAAEVTDWIPEPDPTQSPARNIEHKIIQSSNLPPSFALLATMGSETSAS
jgi:hypothetical protein